MGLEGYGIFWVLVETLRDQPDYTYPLELIPALARRYNTSAAKMRTVIDKYELFSITDDNKFFFSHSLNRRMVKANEKRDKLRANALKRWHANDDTNAMQLHSKSNADLMPLKERKEKESKVNKNKEYIRDSAEAASPNIISLILNDKTEYSITQTQIDGWVQLYPAVDILQELRKMKGWLDANPSKRKTKRGILRFVNNWLSREQDRGGHQKPQTECESYDDGGDFLGR